MVHHEEVKAEPEQCQFEELFGLKVVGEEVCVPFEDGVFVRLAVVGIVARFRLKVVLHMVEAAGFKMKACIGQQAVVADPSVEAWLAGCQAAVHGVMGQDE